VHSLMLGRLSNMSQGLYGGGQFHVNPLVKIAQWISKSNFDHNLMSIASTPSPYEPLNLLHFLPSR
jgi:hypothetical protein